MSSSTLHIIHHYLTLHYYPLETLEAGGGTSSSVNESKQEEDEPLATTSQKLDDERILEALEVHEKLK